MKNRADEMADLLDSNGNRVEIQMDGAKKNTPASELVSILIPCCGMLEYTKLCVASILKHTRAPFEIIFLDIGSLDGTAELLAGVKLASNVHVEIVHTLSGLGISDACNQALAHTRGEYLVLLNNDTVVTEGWLAKLVELINLSPKFGMVGPMSNYATAPQLVEPVPYRMKARKGNIAGGGGEPALEIGDLDTFAREFREKNKGKWMETEHLTGFCLLLRRSALDRIGMAGIQESEISIFDTDNLCTKLRQGGLTLACCRDVFIHHFGTRAFSHGAPQNTTNSKAN